MIFWNEQFATGSSVLDAHHRMLINQINELEMLLGKPNLNREEWDFIVGLVGFLESYAATHFKYEEQCMERNHCPSQTQNQIEHRRFMEFFSDFQKECQAEGIRQGALRRLHQMTSTWIQKHILQVDTQLKRCLLPP